MPGFDSGGHHLPRQLVPLFWNGLTSAVNLAANKLSEKPSAQLSHYAQKERVQNTNVWSDGWSADMGRLLYAGHWGFHVDGAERGCS